MNTITLIDTDILVDIGRNVQDTVNLIDELEKQTTLAISVVTQMELIVGCQSKQELRLCEKFLTRFEIIKLNELISSSAVELLRNYRLSHGLLIADALIAATAIQLNLPFISKNRRDYRFISSLNLLEFPS